jgi:hypothetical protein
MIGERALSFKPRHIYPMPHAEKDLASRIERRRRTARKVDRATRLGRQNLVQAKMRIREFRRSDERVMTMGAPWP